MILVGDININYLEKNSYPKHSLIKAIRSMNMSQLVTTITRPISQTCLDHIYSTHSQFISDIIVPYIGISDHLPVFFCRKYTKQNKNKSNHPKLIEYFDFKNLNVNALIDDLNKTPWETAFMFDDVDDSLDAIEVMLNEVLKDHLKKKQKRVKKVKQPAWINYDIIKSINKRDQELKKARKTLSSEDWAKYKRSKCFVNNLIKKSKRCFFQESIEKKQRKS